MKNENITCDLTTTLTEIYSFDIPIGNYLISASINGATGSVIWLHTSFGTITASGNSYANACANVCGIYVGEDITNTITINAYSSVAVINRVLSLNVIKL